MNWLNKLFCDLSEYDVPPCPTPKKRVEKCNATEIDGEVLNGQLWKTEYNATGLDSERVTSNTPGKRVGILTGWDIGYLNEYHKNAFTGQPTWKRELADKLKAEWAIADERGEYPSAETIVRRHTAAGQSKPQAGYGLSNVKKYFHAFNDALSREMEESEAQKSHSPAKR